MIELYITDYSIKEQAFNGIIPKEADKNIKKIKNCLKTHNLIPLNLGIKNLYKGYIDGKHYRLIVHEFAANRFILVYFRSKNNRYSKNISNYENESSIKALSNYDKVMEQFQHKKFVYYQFS